MASLNGRTGLITGAARGIGRPLKRQIQAPGNRQARRMIGQRQADCDLTIVPLAELAAILTRHAHRMLALLGKSCVIDNPGFDGAMALDRRQRQLSYLRQYGIVRPGCLADKVQKRLMLFGNPRWRRGRRQRLDALAAVSRKKTHAIIAQRTLAIFVADNARKHLDISYKTRFTLLR